MAEVDAEVAYLFRHVVLRDAAYELQPPAERARLHALAFHAMEAMLGGRNETAEHNGHRPMFAPSVADSVAADLAQHAHMAQLSGDEEEHLQTAELHHLWRAANYAAARRNEAESSRCFLAIANHSAATAQSRLAALYSGGAELLSLGNIKLANTTLENALRLARELDERIYQGRCLSGLGLARTNLGDLHGGEAALREAADIARQVGDSKLVTAALFNLARVLNYTGRTEDAERTNLACLEVERQADNVVGIGTTLCNIGNLLWQTGRLAEAEQRYLESLETLRRVDERRPQGNVLLGLGGLLVQLGRRDEGFAYYEEGLALARALHDTGLEGAILSNMAGSLKPEGDWQRMRTLALEALEIHRELGVRRFECYTLGVLCMAECELGDLESAKVLGGQAVARALVMKDVRLEAQARVELAGVCRRAGEWDTGLAHADRALQVFEKTNDANAAASCMAEKALLLRGKGEPAEAAFAKAATALGETERERFEAAWNAMDPGVSPS